MIVFNTDLDNTLIYSYKHDIGNDKMHVEIYQGREISFVTKHTHDLLKKVNEMMLIVPTTTRTQEQYERIDFGIGPIKYALVCNGGVLLVDGKRDLKWIEESRKLIKDSLEELEKAVCRLEDDNRRRFEVRFIENMFVFTKCNEPETVVEDIKKDLDNSFVDVFNNGEKIYVVPKGLDKGTAIERFQKYIGADRIIAAGDSEFDIPMVEAADIGIVPAGFIEHYDVRRDLIQTEGRSIFSEELLDAIIISARER